MRSLIDLSQIVKPGPLNNNYVNKKYEKFSKQFLNDDEKTLNIIPPGLLPSDSELEDYETFEMSCIDNNNHNNIQQRQFINVTAVTKTRKNVIVSLRSLAKEDK